MLPITIEYKGEEWWIEDNIITNIKSKQILTFDDLSEEEIDRIMNQLDERREEIDELMGQFEEVQYVKEHYQTKQWST